MSIYSELHNISGVYFIEDANGVKIGCASDIEKRKTDLQTGNSTIIQVIGVIKCKGREMYTEEKLAHRYFYKYLKHNEWFKKTIKKELEEYINDRNGYLVERQNKISGHKGITHIATLEGVKPISDFRPRCFFYPHLTAHITTKAGTNERYRKIWYKGKRVYVSARKWDEILDLRKELGLYQAV